MATGMTIGKLAKASGVGIETIRYYEREGLIVRPWDANQSGFRKYDQSVLQQLAFIRRAKELGFSLAEIRELLSLKAQPNANCSRAKAQAEQKIAEVERRIADLMKIKEALRVLADSCNANHLVAECTILVALDANR